MPNGPIIDSPNPVQTHDEDGARHARIRRRAYELWEAAGRPEGGEFKHWLAAESEEAGQLAPLPRTLAVKAELNSSLPPLAAGGVPSDVKDPLRNQRNEPPIAPKTSGAAQQRQDASESTVANRDAEGPRKAGTTPRPSRNPLIGS